MKHDDAELYAMAADEMASGNTERGILAKAFAQAQGDEAKGRAFYISLRVEHLKERSKSEKSLNFKKRWRENISGSITGDIFCAIVLLLLFLFIWPVAIVISAILLIKIFRAKYSQ